MQTNPKSKSFNVDRILLCVPLKKKKKCNCLVLFLNKLSVYIRYVKFKKKTLLEFKNIIKTFLLKLFLNVYYCKTDKVIHVE